jgi:AraC-like DNA-binding protein
VRLVPGDVLVQPTLDRHDSRTRRGSGLHLLRLEWQLDPGVGGVYRLDDVDQVIRTARRDPHEASLLLLHLVAEAQRQPVLKEDWPDLLAQTLTGSIACPIGSWAQSVGLARETVARGFFKVFGASPRTFGAELKARAAWLRAVQGTESLAAIAADLGFADQPHMTRAVSALTGAPPHAWRRCLGRFAASEVVQGHIGSRQMESQRL